jgi:hypothetical protein
MEIDELKDPAFSSTCGSSSGKQCDKHSLQIPHKSMFEELTQIIQNQSKIMETMQETFLTSKTEFEKKYLTPEITQPQEVFEKPNDDEQEVFLQSLKVSMSSNHNSCN